MDGGLLLTGGDDQNVLIWPTHSDPSSTSPLGYFTGHNGIILCVQTLDDVVYSCGADGLLIKYSIERAAKTPQSTTNADDATCEDAGVLKLAISSENKNIVLTAAQDGLVKLYDFRASSKEQSSLPKRNTIIEQNHVEFNPVFNNVFVTADTSDEIKLWDLRNFGHDSKPISVLTAPKRDVSSAVFSPDGMYIGAQIQNHFPVIFDARSSDNTAPLCELRVKPTTDHYYQSVITVKTPAFSYIGSQVVFACGSEDFNVHGFNISKDLNTKSGEGPVIVEDSDFTLTGGKSIINNVLIHPHLPLIYSSGVESIVRVYSPFSMNAKDDVVKPNVTRKRLPYIQLVNDYLSRHTLPEELRGNENKVLLTFDLLLGRDEMNDILDDMDDSDSEGELEEDGEEEGYEMANMSDSSEEEMAADRIDMLRRLFGGDEPEEEEPDDDEEDDEDL
ncbi:hypothetical protein SmJEL517_g05167 [Synchytrium microbalum]|uniref:Uncharacterized protein n=1 Tax=Synchytrium microbalum TaxID=1806994 RepID=A0A507C0Q2_9FUNG|nr:uncharacterized protein SmJEL517_g05167 [Synchytrium microbalum]TPX31546.1 hypothetical protein SmJEL517_g05167 [Synchytrium microbalum]